MDRQYYEQVILHEMALHAIASEIESARKNMTVEYVYIDGQLMIRPSAELQNFLMEDKPSNEKVK